MRVIITGSRTWTDEAAIWDALDGILRTNATVECVHGDCPKGADVIALRWAIRQHQHGNRVNEEPHPANWQREGRRAGFLRNAEMVLLGADKCLAFINRCEEPTCRRPHLHGTHGASHCARLAERAGIETVRYEPWRDRNGQGDSAQASRGG